MSSVDRLQRLLVLVPYVLAHPGVTVDELAARHGTSTATMLADLANLAWCGLPGGLGDVYIDVEVDQDGRVRLDVPMEAPTPLRLTDDEALRLLLAVESIDRAFGRTDDALGRAVAKVRQASGIHGRLLDDEADPGADATTTIASAITQDRRVRLRYQGRNDVAPVDRFVDPWRLTRAGWWYVQGHDDLRAALRSFRLDRCLEVEVLDEPRRTRTPDTLPPPRYERSPDDPEVVLDLAPAAAWIGDLVDLDHDESRADGSRRVRFHTDALEWVARLLVAAGAPVAVRAPTALRARVRAIAEAGLRALETADRPPVSEQIVRNP